MMVPMKTIAVHDGSFHPDDVFAVACIQLLEGVEQVTVVRTRDQAIIDQADWVVDVGGEYDPGRRRFDHHQNGAPVRENGIPYAAFGLVWRHYGTTLAGSEAVSHMVEERLCQPIDGPDNGINLFTLTEYQVEPVRLFHVLDSFKPVWGSADDVDTAFLHAVKFARDFLERFIARAKGEQKMLALLDTVYAAAADKSVLIFDQKISSHALIKYPDVIAAIYPTESDTQVSWSAAVLPKTYGTFESRALFPAAWAGLRDSELARASGLSDLLFCHKGRFLCKAKTKEAAVAAVTFLE
jgi:uncharacterized UPF0160 family protein